MKKVVRKQGGIYEGTVYIDGVFEHHIWKEVGGNTKQNNLLHIMEDQKRITLRRVGDTHKDDKGPVIQYHLGDHLGSSCMVIDDTGQWINREEYFPFGETSFGSFARKRYRFTGKERNEESGFYYHGARYYAPWLSRWVSCDPIGRVGLYLYGKNNPLRFADPRGTQDMEIGTGSSGINPATSGTEPFPNNLTQPSPAIPNTGTPVPDATEKPFIPWDKWGQWQPPQPRPIPPVKPPAVGWWTRLLGLMEGIAGRAGGAASGAMSGASIGFFWDYEKAARDIYKWFHQAPSTPMLDPPVQAEQIADPTPSASHGLVLPASDIGIDLLKAPGSSSDTPMTAPGVAESDSPLEAAQKHHIATNKGKASGGKVVGWREAFEDLFAKAKMTLEDPDNLMPLKGHKGTHPPEYHIVVYGHLLEVTEGKTGNAYEKALRRGLLNINQQLSFDPSLVHWWRWK